MDVLNCSIPANPDISGIGVRAAIYIQNLLSFLPAFWALWDGEVTTKELKTVEKQSTTILIIAFAVLISAVVQVKTFNLSAFHTTVILSLSWMNNTNTFIYFLLYIHHKSDDRRGSSQIRPDWSAWVVHVFHTVWPSSGSGVVQGSFELQDNTGSRPSSRSSMPLATSFMKELSLHWLQLVRKKIVLVLGSFHLTLMAVVGLWLWTSPIGFESHQDKLVLMDSDVPPIICSKTSLLGKDVILTSSVLRDVSLAIYACFLVPGINLIIPAMFFLFAQIGVGGQRPASLLPSFISHVVPWGSIKTTTARRRSTMTAFTGLIFLLAINVVFLADIETTISRATHSGQQQQGESDWTFGQTLALLLLVLPLRDACEYIKEMWEFERAQRCTEQLKDAVARKDPASALSAARYASNVSVGIPGIYPSALQFAAHQGQLELVKILIDRHAYIDIEGGKYGAPLVAATSNKQHDVAQLLILGGANIRLADPTGFEPVHHASRHGLLVVLELLQERGVDVDAISVEGRRPLHYAAQAGHEHIVRALLKHGANPYKHDQNGCTPIIYAVVEGHTSLARILLEHHAEILCDGSGALQDHSAWMQQHINRLNHSNQKGETALLSAVRGGNEVLIRLLLEHGAMTDKPSNDGQTPLTCASSQGTLAVVELLLDHGATVDLPDEKSGHTSLSLAAMEGHESVTRLLLERRSGSEVNQPDHSGWTPLTWAARRGHDKVVQLLLDNGATVDPAQIDTLTPLSHAVGEGHDGVAQILLKHGANANHVADNGWTPLIWAARQGHKAVIQLLLLHGAYINPPGGMKQTPLHIAAFCGHEQVVQLLLESGANPNYLNQNGETPLIYGARGGHSRVIQPLIEHGADVTYVARNNQTALNTAIARDAIEVMRILEAAAAVPMTQAADEWCNKDPAPKLLNALV